MLSYAVPNAADLLCHAVLMMLTNILLAYGVHDQHTAHNALTYTQNAFGDMTASMVRAVP